MLLPLMVDCRNFWVVTKAKKRCKHILIYFTHFIWKNQITLFDWWLKTTLRKMSQKQMVKWMLKKDRKLYLEKFLPEVLLLLLPYDLFWASESLQSLQNLAESLAKDLDKFPSESLMKISSSDANCSFNIFSLKKKIKFA